jgi:hypothetical protein
MHMSCVQLLRAAHRLVALGVALVAAGCGSDNVAPVSGRVTLDGQPAAYTRVTFQPIGSADNQNPGPGSYGITDADGRYRLTVVGSGRSGAVVGRHRVSIKSSSGPNEEFPDAPPKPNKAVPKRYNKESTMEVEVPTGGTTAANFDLTTAAKGSR